MTDLRLPAVQKELATTYWKRHDVPDLRRFGYKRVAIVGFSVEFVTAKVEMPLGSQPVVGAPPVTPASAGVRLVGLGRKQVEFDESLMAQVTNDCYAMLVVELASRGMEVVPAGLITGSEAYQRLEIADTSASNFLEEFSVLSSDTGRITGRRVVPAEGLNIITGAQDAEVEDVELDMLDELDIDVALRVRVRAGVYRGKASLERGSLVWVLSRDTAGSIRAERSLISDEAVIDESEFKLTQGDVYLVDGDEYLDAAYRLFPPFMTMAFESGQR